jgi:hypothetical protein
MLLSSEMKNTVKKEFEEFFFIQLQDSRSRLELETNISLKHFQSSVNICRFGIRHSLFICHLNR